MGKTTLAHPELVERYKDDVLEIVDNQLGDDYLSPGKFREAMTPGGDLFAVIAFPDRNSDADVPIQCYYTSLPRSDSLPGSCTKELPVGVVPKPVGICIGGIFSRARLGSYLNLESGQYPKPLQNSVDVGVLRTTSVKGEVQRRGIGTRILHDCQAVLENLGTDLLLGMAWRGPHGVHVHTILTRLGFSAYKEFDNYWMSESLEKGYSCPQCGPPPCRCSGVLYLKT